MNSIASIPTRAAITEANAIWSSPGTSFRCNDVQIAEGDLPAPMSGIGLAI